MIAFETIIPKFEVLTSHVSSSTQKWVKNVQIDISSNNVERKIKIKSKRDFEGNYSFMKQFYQNF